jgi:hypothetical protein
MHVIRFLVAASFLGPFVFCRPALADEDWKPILNATKLSCTKTKPCRITENKTQENFEMRFEILEEPALNLRKITKVIFRNTDKNTTQVIALKEVARVYYEEPFQFFAMDLRRKGFTDLALLSLNSPHNGPLYYYFIYDPATSHFVLNGPAIPKLKPPNSKQEFVSDVDSAVSYKLDAHQNLVLKTP